MTCPCGTSARVGCDNIIGPDEPALSEATREVEPADQPSQVPDRVGALS
jgi:hypothetical protein